MMDASEQAASVRERVVQAATTLTRMRRRANTGLPALFAIVAFLVGTFLVFAQPPGQGLDETVHFDRVWTLAQGDLIAPIHHGDPGDYVPDCVVKYVGHFATEASRHSAFDFNEYFRSPAHCSATAPFTGVGTAAANSPVSYAPSIVAVAVLREIGAPIPVVFFGGRFAGLLGFIIIFWFAMRVAPIGKEVFLVLGLLPTTLLLASSFSADPMAISLAALAAALTLRSCLSPNADLRTAGLLLATLTALGLTKPTLFVFAPLFLLVPTRVLGRWSRPALLRVCGLVVVLGIAALWYLAVRRVGQAPVPIYGLDAHRQNQFIVHHPIGYLKVILRTLFIGSSQKFWISGFFFSIGYTREDSSLAPVGLVIVGSLTLVYAYGRQFGPKRHVSGQRRLLAWVPIAMLAIGVLLVETTLFIVGTPVGLPVTLAQGRYFIPLAFLVIVTVVLLRRPKPQGASTRWIYAGVFVMLVWLVLKIFVHDYSL